MPPKWNFYKDTRYNAKNHPRNMQCTDSPITKCSETKTRNKIGARKTSKPKALSSGLTARNVNLRVVVYLGIEEIPFLPWSPTISPWSQSASFLGRNRRCERLPSCDTSKLGRSESWMSLCVRTCFLRLRLNRRRRSRF